MAERCKTCGKDFEEGIWLSPQFRDEKVLLFCTEKCKKEYLKSKLNRIKGNYPEFYNRLVACIKAGKKDKSVDPKLISMMEEVVKK